MSSRERSRRLKEELDRVTRQAQNFSLESAHKRRKRTSSSNLPNFDTSTHRHQIPPRPRGLRRVGSYDSLQSSLNKKFTKDHDGRIIRKRSNSFDLSPTNQDTVGKMFEFSEGRLARAPRVAKDEKGSKYIYPDYSRDRVSTWDIAEKKQAGRLKKKSDSWTENNHHGEGHGRRSSKSRRDKAKMEKATKKLSHLRRKNSQNDMERQLEIGLEPQYVLPLTWSKAEATIERGDTIIVNPVYYNASASPPGPTAWDSYIRCCAYQEATFEAPSPIFNWLYLGDRHDARDRSTFEDLGISWVINATTDINNFFEGESINGRPMRYMNVNLNDAEGVDIMKNFADTNRFLLKCKRSGGKALVHCRAGMSRSTSIMLAFLMFNETWRLCDALDYCRKKRFICDPNIDFRLQLALYEIFLFGKSSVKARLGLKEWDSYRLRTLLNKPGVEVCYGAGPPPCTIM